MRLKEILDIIDGELLVSFDPAERDITRGYCGDLMSDVMANAEAGAVWITMQVHENVIAIAGMKEIGAVILCAGRSPAESVIEKANEQGVAIVASPLPSYEIAGRLYGAGIAG